jgi:8-oxo-dGTP pyrophosphatase MutT (NUDIX family)
MSKNTLFQYCPKFVLFSKDRRSVLLAQRTGEQDYDGVFTFIGGKTETTDDSLLAGLQREKNEEIGENAKVKVCWSVSCYQVLFRKKDGNAMVIPHHVAIHEGGDITINPEEYETYKWVPVAEIDSFEPKVPNIPEAVRAAERLIPILKDAEFATI